MPNSLLYPKAIDYRQPVAASASAGEPTPLELQRWEDDGGAVIGDATWSRLSRPCYRAISERFHPELIAAE